MRGPIDATQRLTKIRFLADRMGRRLILDMPVAK